MDRGCGAPRLLVLRRAPIRARPVAGRAPPVLYFLGWGGFDYRCSTDGLVTDQWTGWMAGWWSPPFFFPCFSCPDEGHVGGWVGGWRELGRKRG